ncbi:hypothetical protein Btru_027003 [Bulinus truncatus]|nr:hypothetical protein Btru_027003 [Bulinus truncatus]
MSGERVDHDAHQETSKSGVRVFGGHDNNDMSLLKMVISNPNSSLNNIETISDTQGTINDSLCVRGFSSSEEMKHEMQIVLANDAEEFSGRTSSNCNMIIQDAVNVEDIDTQVVYLNSDGTIIFDQAGFSSASSDHDSNILESSTRYMLSTALQGNVILSSNDAHSSGITLGQPSQLGFSNIDVGEEGSKFCHLTDYAQQTLTMVIDSASSLGPEYILVEPGSFEVGQSLALKEEKNTHESYHSVKSALLDIPGVVSCTMPINTVIHHKPSSEASAYSVQLQTLPMHCCSQTNLISSSDIPSNGVGNGENLELDYASLSDQSRDESLKNDVPCIEDKSAAEKQKAELRHLEKSHLEHHLKQSKKKYNESKQCRIEMEQTLDISNDDSQNEETVEDYENIGISDETPIFSSISAKLNASMLSLVPGCQHFLLEEAKKFNEEQNGITFHSASDCTFNGSFNALLKLHNELKSIIKLRQKTFVHTKLETCDKFKEKGINCELLRPYVSARGRQPKCSLKASQMGFVTSLENYLSVDSTWSFSDEKKTESSRRRHFYSNRRKRGRPRKCMQNPDRRFQSALTKNSDGMEFQVTSEVRSLKDDEESSSLLDVPDEFRQENQLAEPETSNPVQSCLVDASEQSQTDLGKQLGNDLNLTQDRSIVPDTQGRLSDDKESGQENPLPTESSNLITRRRGRPCKIYEPHLSVEKVLPRNPLTESASTKQQRNYEEHLAFKFFCSQCSFKTKRQSHFQSHMKCHRDGMEKKYTCSQCDFVTISIPICEICGVYTTDTQKLLHRHMRLKHSSDQVAEKKISCEQCSFSCSHPKEMARHQAGHKRLLQTSNSCPECKKNFRSRMHLQRHMRDVHGPEIRPHLCDICGKAFKRTDALQQHKLVHISRTARRLPFKCPTCGKAFRSQAHLKEHSSMHSSERPYLCQYCGAAFKTQPVQRKHIMTLHIQPKTHICSMCCKQFNTKYALNRHEATHKAESEPATAAAAILIIESDNAVNSKSGSLEEKDALEGHPSALESTSISVDDQVSGCLVQDIIGTAAAVIETPLEQSGHGLEQTFIQGNQDGTLYYFTGELSSL